MFCSFARNDIVPIVMGARPEDYARLAPPHSYIHVDDFESPKELAANAEGHRLLARALPLWRKAQKRTHALLGQRGSQSLRRAADSVWASAGHG